MMTESNAAHGGGIRCLDEAELDLVTGATVVAAAVGFTLAIVTVYTVFRQIGYEAGKDQALRDNRADEKAKDD